MALELIRRIPAAGIAADTDWSHQANTAADWTARGFIPESDGQPGARIPPGKDSRIVAVVVRGEDADGNEVDGQGFITMTLSLVQLVQLLGPEGQSQSYRERGPVDMQLGDLVGETDITREGARVFPRIVSPPVGLAGAVVNVAFYVGVL